MKFIATWFRFEHGKETDAMIAKDRLFDSYPKAKDFLHKRQEIISGLYWAGATIHNEKGELLYEILSDDTRHEYYEDIDAELCKEYVRGCD